MSVTYYVKPFFYVKYYIYVSCFCKQLQFIKINKIQKKITAKAVSQM